MEREACPVERSTRSRRELLKMLPLGAVGLLIDPTWRAGITTAGVALSDAASAAFNRGALAPVFADRDVTPLERYPLNSYLTDDPEIDLDDWRLRVSGLVQKPGEYTLDAIRALPRVRQNTRHICIEGWDVVGSYGGVRVADLLAIVGADREARFLQFRCADDYYESLDLETARHPQSMLCDEMYGEWHFTFAWLLTLAVTTYLAYQVVTRNGRQVLFVWRDVRGVWPMARHSFFFGPKPPIIETYNPLQKLAYTTVVAMVGVSIITGFAFYKPVQLSWVIDGLGGFRLTRVWHFTAMFVVLGFIPGHLVMVALHGWRNFASMWVGK